ncbi:MAG: M13 family metallopeptidase [Alphaproteobacteria bacterium]|nr:M13 family metallopeptidase [Alphaproteobacteria bacterium]MBV9370638.1 M13 family metallopeptidase [Alphaproteobacteria bacterium]MBV9899998.1 M13 family metallopeptidase [Alphaproteobacteria bacterium]
MKSLYLIAASAAALSLSASSGQAAPAAPDAAAAHSFGRWGIDLSARDPSVKPGDSFFDYANGAWYKVAQIRADRPAAGVGMDLQDRTQAQLRAIVEESARAPRGATGQKVGGLYSSFMDEARVERLDAAPLKADLDAIRAVADKAAMARLMGEGHLGFGSSIFGLGVVPDLKGPKVYTPALGISGLGLPDRDVYLADQFKAKKDAYRAYVGRTLKMVDWPDADAAADAVLDFETKIAAAMWTRTERRDPNKAYHPMSVAELQAMAPGFDFRAMFAGAGAPAFERIIVSQDSAVPKVAKLFAETPLDTLKAWEAYHTANSAAPYLSKRFVDSRFELIRAMSGQPQNLTRWERGIALVDSSLGEALGQEYVARYFPASSKKMMEALVANLQAAMRERIRTAAWMSPETRAAALRKQSLQRVKVGYPNKWRDYAPLVIDPADLYGNVERATAFSYRYDMDRLGRPVDRDEWAMTPQTVNAYNNPLANEIVFPAAMLQAPMFDPRADAAVNYGAIGAVIGHEISHGFDDQGRQFDEAGTLRDWWQPADAARFTGEAGKLADQYGGYEGAPGMKVNGRLTLGENIGDQGGVRLALDAYHASLRGRKPPVLDGLSGDQRFFLAWAQGWRGKLRDDIAKMILVSDVHSPYRWRVDGTLRNIDEWYSAFDVRPGDKLYLPPDRRVRVW